MLLKEMHHICTSIKNGAYELIRINMELLSQAHSIFFPQSVIVEMMKIIYVASISLGQCNLKRRIACSSVSHMGFTIVGICYKQYGPQWSHFTNTLLGQLFVKMYVLRCYQIYMSIDTNLGPKIRLCLKTTHPKHKYSCFFFFLYMQHRGADL